MLADAGYSRLVACYDGDMDASLSALVSSLRSPQLWVGYAPVHEAELSTPWTHVTVVARVHAVGALRHIQESYGMAPPTSSAATWRAATDDLDLPAATAPPATPVDARYWALLHNTARRGPLGAVDGARSVGWWGMPCVPQLHESEILPSATSLPTTAGLAWDDIAQHPQGVFLLETHVSLSTGKQLSELAACTYTLSRRLRILGLQSGGRTVMASASPPSPASLVDTLPFNLKETTQQRERRDQVPLPYAYQISEPGPVAPPSLRGTTGQSAIFFEPESDDDEDDEDPDDDLDL